jgi:hypothetical protein
MANGTVKRIRTARLVAAAFEIHCPACGEPQPSPRDGSFLWEFVQVEQAATEQRACCACATPLRIRCSRTAEVA